jgi:ubiquinone/menaquinone biosynthesis C-methylase UbiE
MRSVEFDYEIPEIMYRKFPERSRQMLQKILRLIEPSAGETIVDVGTGAGFLAFGLAEKVGKEGKVIGFDVSKSAIEQARLRLAKKRHYPMLEFTVSDVYAIPLKDDFADVVCCKSLIAGLEYRQNAVREMTRVAKPDGRVVAVEPGDLVGFPGQIKTAFYKTASATPLNERNLRNLFQRAGLRSIEIDTREPPITSNVATFEWTAKNLFGEHGLWNLAVEGGVDKDKVHLFHRELVRKIKTVGLRFGTRAIFCKGVKPQQASQPFLSRVDLREGAT